MVVSDHNPTTELSNLVPASAAPGEEAGAECQGPMQRAAEALLVSLTMVRLLSLEEKKAEEGPEGFFLIKKAGTEYKIRFHAGGTKTAT